MKIEDLKKKKWFTWLVNKYAVIIILFMVWMIFFDDASLLQHIRIDKGINELKVDREFYNKQLSEVKTELKGVKEDPDAIEKIARERFYMKKDNEDIFVIVEEKENK